MGAEDIDSGAGDLDSYRSVLSDLLAKDIKADISKRVTDIRELYHVTSGVEIDLDEAELYLVAVPTGKLDMEVGQILSAAGTEARMKKMLEIRTDCMRVVDDEIEKIYTQDEQEKLRKDQDPDTTKRYNWMKKYHQ